MPRKPKQQQKEYKGDLKKPTRLKLPPKPKGVAVKILLPKSKDTYQEDLARWKANNALDAVIDQAPKLMFLMDHYGIARDDPERWFMLALNLARNHVPGFRIESEKQTGRKLEWDLGRDAFLYFSVMEKIHTGSAGASKTISWACDQLVKQPPWKEMKVGNQGQRITVKTLANRYSEAQKSVLAQMYINIVNNDSDGDHSSEIARGFRQNFLKLYKPSQ